MLKPPELFELTDDPEVTVIFDDIFFSLFGLPPPGIVGKYCSGAEFDGGVLARDVFGLCILFSGLLLPSSRKR
jgi:hypothetical protein